MGFCWLKLERCVQLGLSAFSVLLRNKI